MKAPDYIIIINENQLYKISEVNNGMEAVSEAMKQHIKKWQDIWNEKVNASKDIKKRMISDDEIFSEQDIKVIRIFFD